MAHASGGSMLFTPTNQTVLVNGTAPMSVTGLGDVNADGAQDFAVACPSCTVAGSTLVGLVAVLFGGSHWVDLTSVQSPVISVYDVEALGFGHLIHGTSIGEKFGSRVTTVDDFDGDSNRDFAIRRQPEPAGLPRISHMYLWVVS